MYGVVPPVNASSMDTGIVLVMFGNTFATGFELLYIELLQIKGAAGLGSAVKIGVSCT